MTRIRARMGAKGQVVVPKPVREELGLRPGDDIYISTHGSHAHLERVDAAASWRRAFEGPSLDLPDDFDIDAAIEEGRAAENP